jgi:hypothetical protein
MGRRKGKCVNRSPVVIISCRVLQDILTALLPKDLAQRVTYMDYGLHMLPRRMTTALQEIIEGIEEPSLVVLGYGLCGNGLRGIKAGRHCLLVPRVSDCIALLLGSHETYKKEFGAVPGTYYLSRGWLEAGSHPLSEYEGYVGKYGAERAMWLMDQQYQNYERLVLVAHSQDELDACRPQAEEIARFCARWGLRLEEILGSDGYVRQLVNLAQQLSNQAGEILPGGIAGAHATQCDRAQINPDEDYLIIPPGGEIRQALFVR